MDHATIDQPVQSNRDRVRQLLFVPLAFRFKAGSDLVEGRRMLDRIADDLGYLSDAELATLLACVQTKGEGSCKAFWPSAATFRGWAEVVRPRPLDELPALVSWFASVEGPRAKADGTLVALWRWFEEKKIPPYQPEMRAVVAKRAADYARRLAVIADRQARGVFDPARHATDADDAAFAGWHAQRLAHVEAVLLACRARKAGDAA